MIKYDRGKVRKDLLSPKEPKLENLEKYSNHIWKITKNILETTAGLWLDACSRRRLADIWFVDLDSHVKTSESQNREGLRLVGLLPVEVKGQY